MKKEDLDDYELFYMELPQADYLKDIEIQDEYDDASYDEIQGLSDEQVSEIARDSLDAAKQQRQSADDTDTFFSDESDPKS
jgi:hypothetical protein